MEKKVFVKDLQLHQEVSSIFQILETDLRKTRKGDYFIAMTVGDNTGKLPIRIWSATEELFSTLIIGELLAIKGIRVSEYQGTLQLSINREEQDKIDIYPLNMGDPMDYLEATQKDTEVMLQKIKSVIEEIEKDGLKALLLSFFLDNDFVKDFTHAPAAVRHHHTYAGGLLEHTSSVLNLSIKSAEDYQVDRDLLLTGAILHDIGKIETYTFRPTIQMTTKGRLFSHIVLGVKMLDERLQSTGLRLPKEDYYRLLHMILAHHGKKEWGSPVEPVTLEAVILHHVDYLDAQAHKYKKALNEPSPEKEWSSYQPKIGSQLFIGLCHEKSKIEEEEEEIE